MNGILSERLILYLQANAAKAGPKKRRPTLFDVTNMLIIKKMLNKKATKGALTEGNQEVSGDNRERAQLHSTVVPDNTVQNGSGEEKTIPETKPQRDDAVGSVPSKTQLQLLNAAR